MNEISNENKKVWRITRREAEMRLDVFLTRELGLFSEFLEKPLSRSEISRFIKSGQVVYNSKKAKPSQILEQEDRIEMDISALLSDREQKNAKLGAESLPPESLFPSIVFENEHFFVLDKPAGLLVHSVHKGEESLVSWLLSYYPPIVHIGENPLRPGIVHRLDKETSGLLLVAKTNEAFSELKRIFQERQVKKTYFALVHGHVAHEEGLISYPIGRKDGSVRRVLAVGRNRHVTEIKPAETVYSLEKRYKKTDLLRVEPKTGRTHQIRVHLAALEHPVVGDKLYITRTYKHKNPKSERHLLHAGRLEFPFFGETFVFESSLPEDFVSVLKNA